MDVLQASSARGFEFLVDEYVYYVTEHKNIEILEVNKLGDHYIRINAPLFSLPNDSEARSLHNMLSGFEIRFLKSKTGAIIYYDSNKDVNTNFTYYNTLLDLENDWGSIEYTVKNYGRNLNAKLNARANVT